MDTIHSITSSDWHIPRPSLSGSSSAGSIPGDSRSRGGSASSQGSSSNHSTHSVSSGSFLLSAAHLARMQGGRLKEEDRATFRSTLGSVAKSDAVVTIPEEAADTFWAGVKPSPTKDQDACSVASSTHFTLVNGFSRQRNDKVKTCCCDRSHQITVLVIFMTVLFSACILAAICFVEMRMRRETGIYRYS